MISEPNEILISEDGAGYIRTLTWQNWGSATAIGTGTAMVDNCKPSCAQGHDAMYPATVTVSSPVLYGNFFLEAYSVAVVQISGLAGFTPETFNSPNLVPLRPRSP